jgi:hypothetical protein
MIGPASKTIHSQKLLSPKIHLQNRPKPGTKPATRKASIKNINEITNFGKGSRIQISTAVRITIRIQAKTIEDVLRSALKRLEGLIMFFNH